MNGDGRQGSVSPAVGAAMRAAHSWAGFVAAAATGLAATVAGVESRTRMRERLGHWQGHREAAGRWVWIQAASVGEADIAVALAHAMAARLPGVRFVVSSMTVTGAARVQGEAGIESRYFPIDYAPVLQRIVEPFAPLLFVAIETEIWPGVLRLLQGRGVPTAVVNARLSDRSMPNYGRLAPLLSPLLGGLTKVCARDEEAARRWLSLGARPEAVEVTGNIKFDLATPAVDVEIRPLFERSANTPILLAASTHEGEEELALDAFAEVRKRHGDARLLLAPRHPRRAAEVYEQARSRWMSVVAWSDVVGIAKASKVSDAGDAPTTWPPRVDVIVLDRLGLLRSAYEAARACFVGGSATPGPGGHNLLEATAAVCPTSAGPLLDNVVDQVEVLRESWGLTVVHNAFELSKFWSEVLENPDQWHERASLARQLVVARRGALDRSAEAMVALIARTSSLPDPASRAKNTSDGSKVEST